MGRTEATISGGPMNAAALQQLSQSALAEWIARRMSGAESKPPVDETRLETPGDFLVGVYCRSDPKFKRRCELAIMQVLKRCAAEPNLRDTKAVETLAGVAHTGERLELHAALPSLLAIVERGFLGASGEDAVGAHAYEAVLAAVALLQPPNRLRKLWLALLQRPESRWVALATAGLRRCNAKAAVRLLPAIIQRAATDRSLLLGEILWAYQADHQIGPERLAAGLKCLTAAQLKLCRGELRNVGATATEIKACVPTRQRRRGPHGGR